MRPLVLAPCPKCEITVPVVRAGTYGWRGQRRQLLKCQRCSHRFAEPLPRAVITTDETCLECLNPLGKHQGQPHPRGYHFPARIVAQAMVSAAQAGKGNSYRSIGERVRKRAGRIRYNKKAGGVVAPPARESSTLIADWVEAIAPVLWQEHAPTSWPEMIAIDELDIRGRSASSKRKAALMFPESSKPSADPTEDDEARGPDLLGARPASGKKRGGRKLFAVLGAEGYPRAGRPLPWLFQAAPSGTKEAWIQFFGSLEGRPEIIVGDPAYAWQVAARFVWPAPNTPELLISEFHLARTLDAHLIRLGLALDDEVAAAARAAFDGPREWAVLIALLTPVAARDARLARWIKRWEKVVPRQLTNHASREARRTTGGIEQRLLVVKERIRPRSWLFSNRERMNRLLMLMCLDMRSTANDREWAATIRAHLLRAGGRPPQQRLIYDEGGLDPGGLRQCGSLRLSGPGIASPAVP